MSNVFWYKNVNFSYAPSALGLHITHIYRKTPLKKNISFSLCRFYTTQHNATQHMRFLLFASGFIRRCYLFIPK